MPNVYRKYDTKTGIWADFGDLKARKDIGIVEDTDIAEHSISTGQYVIWKGNLYTANNDIIPTTTLSTNNLTEVTIGGLNKLNYNMEWKLFYDHIYEDSSVSIPSGYKELLLTAYAHNNDTSDSACNAYSIYVNKHQIENFPNVSIFLRTGYHNDISNSDHGSWAVRVEPNKTINGRRISFNNVANENTYIKFYYR